RSLQWLGDKTTKDPRFAVAMVEHVYYILFGRRPLLPPTDARDPHFSSRQRAYLEQRSTIDRIAQEFAKNDFNLKTVFQLLAFSKFYRANGYLSSQIDPGRSAELDDLGINRLLSPEQLERKLAAIFGAKWGRLDHHMAILYGGIDHSEITERLPDPSGAMGAIQRLMANEMACRHTGADFTLPRDQRVLFPKIEVFTLPGVDSENDNAIRETMTDLYERITGKGVTSDSDEIEICFQLFSNIVSSANKLPDGFDTRENYFCSDSNQQRISDDNYTIRAWRAVITFLLRQPEFLYE
ncbi:MAG: hypothetical protein AAF226_19190, partial [Verrucomicrobiota bacterium]